MASLILGVCVTGGGSLSGGTSADPLGHDQPIPDTANVVPANGAADTRELVTTEMNAARPPNAAAFMRGATLAAGNPAASGAGRPNPRVSDHSAAVRGLQHASTEAHR